MALAAYATLKINGEDIAGGVDITGREGTIEVFAFEHEVRRPVDIQRGRGTGTREHRPLCITKEYDSASVYIYRALARNEVCELKIDWYRITPEGMEEVYYSHLIEDARISNIKAVMHNTLDPTKEQFVHMEEICFIYSKITWTYAPDGLEHTDDWRADRAT
jgi:type VI secretion system secreted protein Hcp